MHLELYFHSFLTLDLIHLFSWIAVQYKIINIKIFFIYLLIYVLNTAPWHDRNNRRNFFEEYARENFFDPLIPENWYLQPTSKIMAKEVIILLLFCFILLYFYLLILLNIGGECSCVVSQTISVYCSIRIIS